MADKFVLMDYDQLVEEAATEEVEDLPCEDCALAPICVLRGGLQEKRLGDLVLVLTECSYQR